MRWRTRGHGAGWFVWRRLAWCPPLRSVVLWVVHRFWLAYWYSPDGEHWERIA